MQLDTDLHRFAQIFQRLKQNHIRTFCVISVFLVSILRLVQSSTIEPKCLALFTVCVGSRPIVLLNRVVQSARLNQPRQVG